MGVVGGFAYQNTVLAGKGSHRIKRSCDHGVNQKVLPVLSTETLLHIWLSTEYYGFRPSSTAVDTVSLHALDPTVPQKRKQIGFLLAPIVKELSNIVSIFLMSFFITKINIRICVTSKSSTFFLFSANFYHYKNPRQTKLSGVIPCQKFFGEPVLFTTFGRFYHPSKKDVIRLLMTTDTDVNCLNIITIRLSIVFGDCMQSAEVKSNVFMRFFSSPEPLGSQGELIVKVIEKQ